MEAVPSIEKTAAAVAIMNKAGKAGSVTNSNKKSVSADSAETNAPKSVKQEARIVPKTDVKVKAEAKPAAPAKAVAKAASPAPPAPVSPEPTTDVKVVKVAAKPAEPAKAAAASASKPAASKPAAFKPASKPAAPAVAAKPAPKAQVASAAAAPVEVKTAAVKAAAPTPSVAPVTAAKPAETVEASKIAPKAEAPRQPGVHRTGFKAQEFIVYPAHGVGQILAIEEQEVAGYKLELFVINFAKDKMTLKVPLPKVLAGAIRKLADEPVVKRALDTLTGRARVKRTMWSRRAQEYEAKINSGDLIAIAEVVRDLYRSDAQPEQSYSERQLYEAAVDRMARELAAVRKLTDSEALKLVEQHLERGPKRGPRNEAIPDAEGDTEADVEVTVGEIEAAA